MLLKNNSLLNKIFIVLLAVFFSTANSAYALALPTEVKTIAVKFTLAMLGVVVFSIVISIGLSLYNRFFVSSQIKDFKLSRDSLRTPADKDEAIMMFITKNRLK